MMTDWLPPVFTKLAIDTTAITLERAVPVENSDRGQLPKSWLRRLPVPRLSRILRMEEAEHSARLAWAVTLGAALDEVHGSSATRPVSVILICITRIGCAPAFIGLNSVVASFALIRPAISLGEKPCISMSEVMQPAS